MKKVIAMLLCVMFLFAVTGCADGQMANGKYCDSYGLLNKETKCEGVASSSQ
jgi:hypothetical protein